MAENSSTASESSEQSQSHEDRALIEAAQSDPQAFSALYAKYVDKIYNYVYYRVNHHEETAEDITAEVFTRALRRLPDFEWQGHPYSAYLYQVARSLCQDHYKKSEKQTVDIDDVVTSDAGKGEEALTSSVELQGLWERINELDPPIPEVFELRYLEDLSYKEIAEVIGKSAGSIRTLVSRTISTLQQHYVTE